MLSRLFTILLFVTIFCHNETTMAQSIIGRWLADDYKPTYFKPRSEADKEQLKVSQKKLNDEIKGKIIHEYKTNGLLYIFRIDGGDTTEYERMKWWIKGDMIYTDNPEYDKPHCIRYKIKDALLYHIETIPETDIITTIKWIQLPGESKSEYSDDTYNSFFNAGIAPLNKKWTTVEYCDAAMYLLDLDMRKVSRLPHHTDSSMAILKKITNCDSIAYLDIKANTFAFATFQKFMAQLMMRYSASGKNMAPKHYSEENALIQIALLCMSDKIIKLQKDGFVKKPVAYTSYLYQIIDGYITTFENDTKNYRSSDLCKQYVAFSGFYLKYKNDLSDEARKGFDERIVKIRKKKEFNFIKQ